MNTWMPTQQHRSLALVWHFRVGVYAPAAIVVLYVAAFFYVLICCCGCRKLCAKRVN